MEFVYENVFGNKKVLTVGQKVECIYYNEYGMIWGDDAYKRTWLSLLLDKPFKPVKLGVIIGDAGVHPFWMGVNGKEQYLLVRFKEYLFPKPIPISCINDAMQSVEKVYRMIERDKDKMGQKGYEEEYFDTCLDLASKAHEFATKS
jgi:hypothetical protein